MKILNFPGVFFICLVSGSAFAEILFSESKENTASLNNADDLSDSTIQQTIITSGNKGKASLIPPGLLPDPFPIPDNSYEFDTEIIKGTLKHNDTVLKGLSSLVDNMEISMGWDNATGLLVYLDFSARIDNNLTLTALQNTNLTATIALGEFALDIEIVGKDELEISIENLTVGTHLILKLIKGSIQVEAESLVIELDNIIITGDLSIKVNGAEMVGPELLEFIKVVLQILPPRIIPLMGDLLTGLLKDCKLTDLLNSELSCTGLVPAPTTTTTPRNTPPTPWPDSGTMLETSKFLLCLIILQQIAAFYF